jgi:hypothetical protein
MNLAYFEKGDNVIQLDCQVSKNLMKTWESKTCDCSTPPFPGMYESSVNLPFCHKECAPLHYQANVEGCYDGFDFNFAGNFCPPFISERNVFVHEGSNVVYFDHFSNPYMPQFY